MTLRPAVAAALALVTAMPAHADDCARRIGDILTRSVSGEVQPGRARMTIEMKGAPTTVSEYLLAGPSHGLHKPVKPKMPTWTLTTPGAMFQTSDEGKTWKKLMSFDAKERAEQTAKSVAAQAASVKNAVCGEETLDGVAHERMEADLANPPPGKMTMRNTYWVNKKTGFVTKTVMRVTGGAPNSVTTQEWTPEPGLTLPLPE